MWDRKYEQDSTDRMREWWIRRFKGKTTHQIAAKVSNYKTQYGRRFHWITYTIHGKKLKEGWAERCRVAADLALHELKKYLDVLVKTN